MTKKFFIIAGEASGDLLGSKLIAELKLQNPQSKFIGIGGKLMQEQGLFSIFPMEELSIMGFVEIMPHIPKLLRRIKETAERIKQEMPDFVITIDSPDFCFRVIKKIQNFAAVKKIHLIAPSVWAYREGRAEKIAKLYDLLLAILPFEPPYFEKYGLKTVFIGHPIMENVPDFARKNSENLQFRQKYSIKEDDLLICITPGSRNGEVAKIFPEFIGAINLLAQNLLAQGGERRLKAVIPLVDKTRALVSEMAKALKVEYFLIEKDEKNSAFFASNFALAKSGTNALELSLYRLPMIVAYKINFLTHFLLKRMVKIKFANLVNLILNEEVIPEMLQKNCNAEKIFHLLERLILDKNLVQKQITKSELALKMMGLGSVENPSRKAARVCLQDE
jgi:lipid-A-disaccharide synthase